MTELAYLSDLPSAYVRRFRARVSALPPGAVVLDRTYFYPAGGGQPSDRGTLRTASGGALEVVEVTKSGSAVIHRVRGDSASVHELSAGAEVEGILDWHRRHRHMRLHTAQHLASARVFARFGVRTRRAALHGSSAAIDLDGPLSTESLEQVAADVRDAVDHPRAVSVRFVPRVEWDAHPASARSGLVPLPTQVDPVRVVEIDASDVCPCGGTHVRSTGEIGPVRWLPLVSLAGGIVRISFTLVDDGSSTRTE